jgi:hypothetical protein
VRRAASVFVLTVVFPLALSLLTRFIVDALVAIHFIVNDEMNVMLRTAGVLVDLLLQSAYFSGLTLITENRYYLLVLVGYQFFIVFMFLRYGAPTLFSSVYGSIEFFGLW